MYTHTNGGRVVVHQPQLIEWLNSWHRHLVTLDSFLHVCCHGYPDNQTPVQYIDNPGTCQWFPLYFMHIWNLSPLKLGHFIQDSWLPAIILFIQALKPRTFHWLFYKCRELPTLSMGFLMSKEFLYDSRNGVNALSFSCLTIVSFFSNCYPIISCHERSLWFSVCLALLYCMSSIPQ